MHRTLIAAVVGAVLGGSGVVTTAHAGPLDDYGTWSVASAEWRFHDGQGELRGVEIDVTQHRSVSGHLTTSAWVFRERCQQRGNVVTCSGGGPRPLHVSFTHDALMGTAHLKIVLPGGRSTTATWHGQGALPEGIRQDRTECILGPHAGESSTDTSILRAASVTAHAFGQRWGGRHLVEAYVAAGAGTRPPC